MSVRPMTTTIECETESMTVQRDTWIMARSKIKYYGAYPSGFLERARNILCGGRPDDSIWHIPGGMAHTYNGAGGMPLSGYGPNDVRIDLNPDVNPDIRMDVRDMHEIEVFDNYNNDTTDPGYMLRHPLFGDECESMRNSPSAIIIDLPYTDEDAKHYPPGPCKLPNLNETLRECLRIVTPGGLVGALDYRWPNGSKYGAKCLLCATVTTGEGSRARLFTVWSLRK